MTESNLSLNHRLAELHQVADELRVARVARPTDRRRPNALRLATGRAFLAVASALLADPQPTRLPAR